MKYYNTKKGFGICAVCFLLVAVLLCGMMTSWFKDWNPYCWFGHDYGEDGICTKCGAEKPVEEEKEDDEGGMDIAQIQTQGVVLAMRDIPRVRYAENGISTQAESAKQLTATIEPADALDKTVVWSASWENAEDAWAKDKNVSDYVTVTPTADGALTANVVCLQAFGNPVIITVSAKANALVSATCKVDYIKRISAITIAENGLFTLGETNVLTPYVEYGVGTVTGEVAVDSMKIVLSDALNTAVYVAINDQSAYGWLMNNNGAITVAATKAVDPFDFLSKGTSCTGELSSYNQAKYVYNKFLSCVDQSVGSSVYYFNITLNCTYRYGDNTISSNSSVEKQFFISRGSLVEYLLPTGITLDTSSIVF